MMSLFPSDDALPTWLHTTLLFLIVSPFFGYFLWYGIGALVFGRLEPLEGPELGEFLFGKAPLRGRAAYVAGLSLVTMGFFFIAIALRYSRLEFLGDTTKAILPWALIAVSTLLSFWVPALV